MKKSILNKTDIYIFCKVHSSFVKPTVSIVHWKILEVFLCHCVRVRVNLQDSKLKEHVVDVVYLVVLCRGRILVQDAIVLALKSFRRRFTQFFHSIYVPRLKPSKVFKGIIARNAVNRSSFVVPQ